MGERFDPSNLPDGDYPLGERIVIVKNGKVKGLRASDGSTYMPPAHILAQLNGEADKPFNPPALIWPPSVETLMDESGLTEASAKMRGISMNQLVREILAANVPDFPNSDRREYKMSEEQQVKSPEHVFCEHLLAEFQRLSPTEFSALHKASTFGIHFHQHIRSPGYVDALVIQTLLGRGLIEAENQMPRYRLTWLGMQLFGIPDEEAYKKRRNQ